MQIQTISASTVMIIVAVRPNHVGSENRVLSSQAAATPAADGGIKKGKRRSVSSHSGRFMLPILLRRAYWGHEIDFVLHSVGRSAKLLAGPMTVRIS
jgi:hypothetical protein